MGYRSAVTAIVYGDEADLTTYMTKDKLEHGDDSIFVHFKGQLKRFEIEFAKGTLSALMLALDHVKWYDDYKDVLAWHRFMELSENHDLNYEFIRIGEDYDDIQKEEGGDAVDGLLYTSVSIERDFPQPTKEETL